ncbi:MAG: alpha/beta hydrolase [Actinobacteria bacterium]|nr:MAG: alpha/beta hydrolase [Actinomycetota bacterium]
MLTIPRFRLGLRLGRLACVLLAVGILAAACTGRKQVAAPSPSVPPTAGDTSPPPSSTATGTASPSPSSSGGSVSPGSVSIPPPPPLTWRSCTPGAFQCSTIAVPIDWSHPSGGPTVRLSLIRLPASGAKSQRIGSLFVNPGGPGASAVDFARQIGGVLPSPILRRFDIVAFDPRGMGGSSPLACENGPGLDAYLSLNPDPTTPAEIQTVVSADQQFAAGCAKQYGTSFLAHIDTRTAARDMDYIRAALGEPTLTYIGYSYGTFLGAQYAELFPTHVRALVLDGAVDPALGGLQFDVAQGVGFDKELGDFFDACVQGCPFYSGGDPKGAFMSLMNQVAAHPLAVGSRQLTLALFLNGVADALYTPTTWPDLQAALASAAQGNGTRLLALSDDLTERQPDGSYNALSSALPAVNCVDSTYPTNIDEYKSKAAEAAKVAPIFGPGGHRHHGRPGHAVPVGASPGVGALFRCAAHPCGRGPHLARPGQRLRRQRGGDLPDRPRAAGQGLDVRQRQRAPDAIAGDGNGRVPAVVFHPPYLGGPGSYSSGVTSRSSPHCVLPPGLKATWIM